MCDACLCVRVRVCVWELMELYNEKGLKTEFWQIPSALPWTRRGVINTVT